MSDQRLPPSHSCPPLLLAVCFFVFRDLERSSLEVLDEDYIRTPREASRNVMAEFVVVSPPAESIAPPPPPAILRPALPSNTTYTTVGEYVPRPVERKSSAATIDVVYALVLPETKQYANVDLKDVETLLALTAKHVVGNGGRVHLLTNDDNAIALLSELAHSSDAIKVYDYRLQPPSERLKDLQANYIHQSANPEEFEAMCFWRWVLIADYFQGLKDQGIKADRILALDTDIVMLQDPRLLFSEKRYQQLDSAGSYMVVSGGAMAFSPHGLEYWVEFIMDTYKSRRSALRRVEQHADTLPLCRPERSAVIPCSDGSMRHFSDMYLFKAWYDENPTNTAYVAGEERCFVLTERLHDYRMTKNDQGTILVGKTPEEASPVCFMHFAGAKIWIKGFARLLAGETQELVIVKKT